MTYTTEIEGKSYPMKKPLPTWLIFDIFCTRCSTRIMYYANTSEKLRTVQEALADTLDNHMNNNCQIRKGKNSGENL